MRIGICCITYNRLVSLTRLLKSLEGAYYDDNSVELIISIDKSDSIDIEDFANKYQWKYGQKHIIAHKSNLGLRKHILSCGQLLNEYDALVVLEDDIVVSPNYYRYVVQCVDKYRDVDRIAGISLYNFSVNYQTKRPFLPMKSEYDVYFMNCAQSWGQVWLKKQWFAFYEWYQGNSDDFDLPYLPDSLNKWPKSSWLKYHTRYCIETDKYFVYPYCSLSTNNSDVGTHNQAKDTLFQVPLSYFEMTTYKLPKLDETIVKYDGFFEPKFLAKYLNVNEKELCVDVNSAHNLIKERFILSNKILDYKVLDSYSLDFKPFEINIMTNNKGNDLFLYDSSVKVKNNNKPSSMKLFRYIYGNAVEEVSKTTFLLRYYWRKIIRKLASIVK